MGSKNMNRGMIGFSIESGELEIIRDDVIQYAEATGDRMDRYGGEKPEAPPFFISKLLFPYISKIIIHPDLNFNLLKMVHATLEASWNGRIRAGDHVKIKIGVKNIFDTPAGEMIEIAGSCLKDGFTAVEGIMGFLVRKKTASRRPVSHESERFREFDRLDALTARGQELKYARASGDNNFIHTSPVLARLAGLPGTIMQGVCVAAICANSLADRLAGGDTGRLAGISVRFSRPVIPGDRLSIAVYESDVENEYPFEVFGPTGRQVLRNGLLRMK